MRIIFYYLLLPFYLIARHFQPYCVNKEQVKQFLRKDLGIND